MNLSLLLALGATVASSAALAAPTAYVAPFKGKTGGAVREQVSRRVCAAATCVERSRAAKADFTLQGNVTKAGKRHLVTLEVTPAGKKKPSWRKTVGVTADGTQLADPDKVLSALLGAMGLEGGRAEPAARPQPEPVKRDEEVRRPARTFAPLDLGGGEVAEAPAAPGVPRAAPETSPARAAPAVPAEARREVPAQAAGKPFAVVQVGTDVLTRNFSYADLQIANLRGFRTLAIVLPSVQLQLRPFTALGSAWPARLRLEGGFATSVGLRASISSRDVTWPASVTRVDGGLRVDLLAPAGTGAGLELLAGYRSQSFTAGQAKDGSVLDGLVSPSWSALRAGAAGSWNFGRITAFLELAALPLLGTGELQATYFPRTTGFGLEGLAGLDVALMPWLGVRLAGQATQYGTTFTTSDTDTYLARGATDLYAGATVALRAGF